MSLPLEHLFRPIRLGSMTVGNRLVMPPMSLNFGVDEAGLVTEQHWAYLAARAKAGTGMITVGGGAVHPSGLDLPRMPPLWSDRFIGPLKTMTAVIHEHDTRFGMQLLHGGRQAFHAKKVAPSAIPALAVVKGVPKALSGKEIRELIGAYGDAARRCQEAGFDFVEIHAAHGYLITQFLAPNSNHRRDAYGGAFENRIRFLLEVVRDIREKTGPGFPLGVRINGEDYVPDGWRLEDMLRLAPILEACGVDWLHISAGIYGSMPVTIPSMYGEVAGFVHLAEAVKHVVSVPVIAVGRIKDPRLADRIIGEGRADMVAMGRAHLADPELARKAREGRFQDIRPCIGCCKGCIERALALEEGTCVINPAVGREYLYDRKGVAASPKRLLVVGAGPAGLTVSRRAALRGHRVTLVEAGAAVGGMARLAALVPGRGEIGELITYYLRELERLGVEIRLNTAVDPGVISEIGPDAAVVATGGVPEMPQISGLFDTAMTLHTVADVLASDPLSGDRVVVLGGGMAALQGADFLAGQGKAVTVLNRGDHFAPEMAPNDRTYLMERLKCPGVHLYKKVRIEGFGERRVSFCWNDGERAVEEISDIVLAEGMRPDRQAVNLFRAAGIDTHVIGDAKAPRTFFHALAEADELGRAL